jgi:hypothetical protein
LRFYAKDAERDRQRQKSGHFSAQAFSRRWPLTYLLLITDLKCTWFYKYMYFKMKTYITIVN